MDLDDILAFGGVAIMGSFTLLSAAVSTYSIYGLIEGNGHSDGFNYLGAISGGLGFLFFGLNTYLEYEMTRGYFCLKDLVGKLEEYVENGGKIKVIQVKEEERFK